mmetsp:Transcript_58141/g.182495  ORF Transcript_58141/g.182495 Transcript_58141/m.182495 type:complete len:264 (-) Transcript_58141:1298-2089(-)
MPVDARQAGGTLGCLKRAQRDGRPSHGVYGEVEAVNLPQQSYQAYAVPLLPEGEVQTTHLLRLPASLHKRCARSVHDQGRLGQVQLEALQVEWAQIAFLPPQVSEEVFAESLFAQDRPSTRTQAGVLREVASQDLREALRSLLTVSCRGRPRSCRAAATCGHRARVEVRRDSLPQLRKSCTRLAHDALAHAVARKSRSEVLHEDIEIRVAHGQVHVRLPHPLHGTLCPSATWFAVEVLGHLVRVEAAHGGHAAHAEVQQQRQG